jgi:hypothetical protein
MWWAQQNSNVYLDQSVGLAHLCKGGDWHIGAFSNIGSPILKVVAVLYVATAILALTLAFAGKVLHHA